MRKRVKKQLREQEKKRFSEVLDKVHQLEIERANLSRACNNYGDHNRRLLEENAKLDAIFRQLQKEYEDLSVDSGDVIREKNALIEELTQPWWRRWWSGLKNRWHGIS